MRYELTDHEWAAIKPVVPDKPRGVPRVNDRRCPEWHFLGLAICAPWRDLPQRFGTYTACYNRFVRWRQAICCGVKPLARDTAAECGSRRKTTPAAISTASPRNDVGATP